MPVIDTAGYAKVPHWLMQHGPHPYLVYGALCAFAWQRDAAAPSHRDLAEKTGLGVTSVKRALARLVELGAIVATEQRGRKGERLANIYDIRPALMHDPTPRRDATIPQAPRAYQEQEQDQEDLLSGATAPDAASSDLGSFEAHLKNSSATPRPRAPASAREARRDVAGVCDALADHVATMTGRRPTIGRTWDRDIRLMIDNDGRTEDDAMRVIVWLGGTTRDGQFWARNILSPKKLRQHFARLVIDMGGAQSAPRGQSIEDLVAMADRFDAEDAGR